GHFGRHVRRMREVYAERHEVLISSAEQELQGLLQMCSIEAGLQTIGSLPAGVDGDRVAALAGERGVEVKVVIPGAYDPDQRHVLQLGFAAVLPAEIRRGVRVLRDVIRGS